MKVDINSYKFINLNEFITLTEENFYAMKELETLSVNEFFVYRYLTNPMVPIVIFSFKFINSVYSDLNVVDFSTFLKLTETQRRRYMLELCETKNYVTFSLTNESNSLFYMHIIFGEPANDTI